MNKLVMFLAVAGLILAVSVSAKAAVDAEWSDATGGAFLSDDNWLGSDAPDQDADTAKFNMNNDDYTVTFAASETNAALYVENDTVTFGIGAGNTYTVTAFDLAPANGDTGELTVTSGTLTASTVRIGAGSNASTYGVGTLNVDGATVNVTGATMCYIGGDSFAGGYYGEGHVNVTSGGTFARSGGGTTVGNYYGGDNKITVSGAGSSFSCEGMSHGFYGDAATEILAGGSFTTTGEFKMGLKGGNGTMNSSVLVSGNNSSFTATTGICVGSYAQSGSDGSVATFTVQSGASATIGYAHVGCGGSGQMDGTINVGVFGTATATFSGAVLLGDTDTVQSAYGYFNIGAGGTVTATSTFKVQATGTLTFTEGGTLNKSVDWGGTLQNEGLINGTGTINLTSADSPGNFTSTGTISPGASIGTLTITGGAAADTLDCTGGTLELEFKDDAGGDTCDLIELTTAGTSIDLTDVTLLDFEGLGFIGDGSEEGTHDLLKADTITGFDIDNTDIVTVMETDLGFASDNWDLDVVGDAGSGQSLRLTYVPEPATVCMLVLGGIGVLIRRRRTA